MEKKINKDNQYLEPSDNDELDLRFIYQFLLRNRLIIGSLSIIFSIIGFLYSLTLKRVWEGQFQIVLDSERNVDLVNPALQNFLSIKNNPNDIETEVEILRSPSVLMPIYEFALSNSKSDKNLNYESWTNNLNVDLKRGTSILNISYRDSNKDLILPILEKMTFKYQDYSGSNRRRSQQLTRKYLNEQIDLFKKKSSNSLKSAQEFALDQDLIFNKVDPNNIGKSYKKNEREDFIIRPNIAIENLRVRAASEIRQINSQLKKISSIGNDYAKLQYIGSTMPDLESEGLPSALADLEELLAENRLIYSENDIVIKEYLQKRDALINLLKKRLIGYLNAKKMKAESIMQSAMRPKGVILEYKELIRQAERDENTLVSLENQLRVFELDEAKYNDPWKLITQPTLLKNPVAPSRKNISFLAFILGTLIGTLIAIYKEKALGYIQDKYYLEKLLSIPLLYSISWKDQKFDSEDLLFFVEYLRNQSGQSITFLALNNNDYVKLENLKEFLINKTKLNKKINLFLSSSNFGSIKSEENLLLFTSIGNVRYEEVETLKGRIILLKINLKGFILF